MLRPKTAGVVGLILLGGVVLPSPFGVVCVVLACVLGAIAGWLGSRWWFALPGAVVTVCVGLFVWLTVRGVYR